ncbi:MAG: ribosome-associated ATPase/putative transporter RbbA [Planctomycetota bacterium]
MNHLVTDPVIAIESLCHQYGSAQALNEVTLSLPAAKVIGLIGPDGVGKSTLMSLIAGAKVIQTGSVDVLGGSMADAAHRRAVCPCIAFMPQGLGKNLYAELSVFENLDFFGRLFDQSRSLRRARMKSLMTATGLSDFADRPAGKLSGGMKQKLGLCCALIHSPDLLLLDEPTTGVDPLSRQQFWHLIERLREEYDQMSVVVSTAYMEEAESFDSLVAMHSGRVLMVGTPAHLREQTKTETLEEAFVTLLPSGNENRRPLNVPSLPVTSRELAIEATGLTRRFGSFVAVNDVSLRIHRGEIFGFLGSNGCGKTTTMKMLTGLLPASEGSAKLFGKTLQAGKVEMRRRVGYMSQSFSLYGELSVDQNLWLHARLFDLPIPDRRPRVDELKRQFGLTDVAEKLANDLPLGVRQRLSLAVAVLHRPDMLILDEPTSGVDPVARDHFWRLLIELSREHGVTIFISTHFMNEAMRCDRISLMHAGNVLASDTPQRLVQSKQTDSLEKAFIQYMQDAIETPSATVADSVPKIAADSTVIEDMTVPETASRFRLSRLLAYSYREGLEVMRDPVRLAFAFIGSLLLMFVFGYGITDDVNDVKFAVLDHDQTPASRDYVSALDGSAYFVQQSPLSTRDQLVQQLKSNQISLAIELPHNYGRELRRGAVPEVSAWIDGANPSRASTTDGYVQGVHRSALARVMREDRGLPSSQVQPLVRVETRFRYNPTFESIYSMVPSVPAILLVLIPAILMAVSVVKEKELGSITNFYVTPTTKLEFLIGKQLPYVMIGFANFVMMTLFAVFLFDVPLKGSSMLLSACAVAYVAATTSIGLLVSSFTRSQVAAVFVSTIVTIVPTLQFSGMMQPVSTLEGPAFVVGKLWPAGYYMHASIGAFAKGLSASELLPDFLALVAFTPVLLALTSLVLRKQEA